MSIFSGSKRKRVKYAYVSLQDAGLSLATMQDAHGTVSEHHQENSAGFWDLLLFYRIASSQ